MIATVGKTASYIVFEVQGRDQDTYASPYIKITTGSDVAEKARKITDFFNNHRVVYIIKQGPSLNSLTSTAVIEYKNFIDAYENKD